MPTDLSRLQNGLIVSCQPVPGGPMDDVPSVVGFARAALAAGAVGLRIESLRYVEAVRAATDAPIIGIVKRDFDAWPVRITALLEDVAGLLAAGADIIAFDATQRPRPVAVADLIAAIRTGGALAMADCATLEDAEAALAAGADIVASTLSGYAGETPHEVVDLDILPRLAALTPNVIAEGFVRTPTEAAAALRAGAMAVVVGSAVTRPEHIVSWFNAAMRRVSHPATALAIDLGGTKTMIGLIENGAVLDSQRFATDQAAGPDGWLDAIARAAEGWRGDYTAVGAAVSGLVEQGLWSALNRRTLDIAAPYSLERGLAARFGVPAIAVNDAQAAAWGEYRFGGHGSGDLVFITASTGIGGAMVLDGRLRGGLAGHVGQMREGDIDAPPLEDLISGRAVERGALALGITATAEEVFGAAAAGDEWASGLRGGAVRGLARLLANLQYVIDPSVIVLGGGIGLSAGFIADVENEMLSLPERARPRLRSAALGTASGLVGIADLAATRAAG